MRSAVQYDQAAGRAFNDNDPAVGAKAIHRTSNWF